MNVLPWSGAPAGGRLHITRKPPKLALRGLDSLNCAVPVRTTRKTAGHSQDTFAEQPLVTIIASVRPAGKPERPDSVHTSLTGGGVA